MIYVERARRETPGCEERIHLNNAGAALQPTRVLEAVLGHLELETRLGWLRAEDAAADAIARIYDSAATLVGARREEIAVVENATRAWDMAFYSIPFRPGDRILTSEAEYASNYIAYLQVAQRTGAVVEPVASDETGALSVEALRATMDERVRLISITHVPTNGGLVNPAAEVGAVAREAGCLYLLDACQSAGQLPVDVEAIGCDFLSATSRKFLRGPRGCGVLYVRSDRQEEPPFLDLHAAEWVAPGKTRSAPTRAGSRTGSRMSLRSSALAPERLRARVGHRRGQDARLRARRRVLRERLDAIPRVTVRDLGRIRCGIVSFSVHGVEPAAAQATLRAGVKRLGRGAAAHAARHERARARTDAARVRALLQHRGRARPRVYRDRRALELAAPFVDPDLQLVEVRVGQRLDEPRVGVRAVEDVVIEVGAELDGLEIEARQFISTSAGRYASVAE